jgi:hypothetical protein
VIRKHDATKGKNDPEGGMTVSKRHRAEAGDVRAWDRGVAERNELDEVRTWVVWGEGALRERAAEPERAAERPGRPGNDIARRIAESVDPDWAKGGGWVLLVEADEDLVDEWVLEDASVRGYAPYLVEPENAAAEPRRLQGVLRSDVVRRRKEHRFDTGRPM